MAVEAIPVKQEMSRRQYLKISLLSLLGLGFTSRSSGGPAPFRDRGLIGRVATDEKTISIYQDPSEKSRVIRETSFDELLPLYYQKTVPNQEGDRKLWHRVWGGFLPGAYVQPTRYRLNVPDSKIPDCGALAEVTVPYTEAYTRLEDDGWKKKYRLYYQTTHWVTGTETGPDGNTWYVLTSELSKTLSYIVRREHLRILPIEDYLPTRIQVPPEEKHIEVTILTQLLTAFEFGQPVFQAKISSGIGYNEVPHGTGTPTGTFRVASKYPSKHMGSSIPTGAPGSYSLPGVPWSTFFIYETGVAFHGTYWHNNFGSWMSHGCINMRNEDAHWLFRWVNPSYDPPYKNHCDWYQTGRGTKIVIS